MACWLFSNSMLLFELHHDSSSDRHITNEFDNGRGYLTTAPPQRPRDHRDIVRLALLKCSCYWNCFTHGCLPIVRLSKCV